MDSVKVALLGFGTVGEGVYDTIHSHQKRLQALLGKKVEIVGVLVRDQNKKRKIHSETLVTSNMDRILEIPDLDVVIEAIVGIEPGYTYLKKAMETGCHVITANKELLAHKGKELREYAEQYSVRLEFEAAVAGGIPAIGTFKQLLKVNRISKIEAILNGTSNYILSDIASNQKNFDQALASAQEKGYAEANPDNDIDGWDALFKLTILSDLLYGIQPEWEKMVHIGIRNLALEHIEFAQALGMKIKHVASIELIEGEARLSVEPVMVGQDHPLYGVDGVNNALAITGDLVGQILLQGPGAGALPTASAIIEDFVNLFQTEAQTKVQQDVTLAPSLSDEMQEWVLIGSDLPSNGIPILNKYSVPAGNTMIQGWRVAGSEREIRSLVSGDPKMKGYRIALTGQKDKILVSH
ncbi:homoserine dehydrogenase [Aquibacillus sp. 3ASR75-11]|uniref:Homoserine dehydrogenase n=1 Tax=Terrihalobacillus insolitus TaxID=2950438 RepID=A0A9X3WRM8_9BACI|nr:homoserine dehydrogenase [Terrihalobacillus insolitus]MDC3412286.1 homoserine dehydrogenase [Terrihalobacillus insolitus]MDC3423021.1 homoserine dehydrogenase [Terrihalobacillus insolitus]